MQVAIIGAGSWGTALGIMAARKGHDVRLWARRTEVAQRIEAERENALYLPGHQLPRRLRATDDLEEALRDAEMVIYASPSHAARDFARAARRWLVPGAVLVSAAKGIEGGTGARVSDVFAAELEERAARVVALSGPSFAREVVAGHPTAIVAAGRSLDEARRVQWALSYENLRIYANDDLTGTEMGGAVKNVIALAAGMVVGLGLGANSLAALITRGLAEMTRLAVAAGARLESMLGLAGVGDLVLTCTSEQSRNRRVGREWGAGDDSKRFSAKCTKWSRECERRLPFDYWPRVAAYACRSLTPCMPYSTKDVKLSEQWLN